MDAREIYLCFIFSIFLISAQVIQSDEEKCECVPYFQCLNGIIVTDGEGILDRRMNTCLGLNVCCLPPTTTNAPPLNPVDLKDPRPDSLIKYPLPVVLGLAGCGRKRRERLQSRISNVGLSGETFYGESPWMAKLIYKDKFICAGTLIEPSIVMTAAHCIPDLWFSGLTIKLGEYNNTSTTDEPIKSVDKQVKKILTHPEFNSKNLVYDVALIELDTPADLSETVDVICLPNAFKPVNTKNCVAYGWGVRDQNSKSFLDDTLKKVGMSIITKDECQSQMRLTRLGKYFSFLPGFLCAGGVFGKDTCKGDGGGPLICPLLNDEAKLVQVGIISWGIDCGKGNPTVFTSVEHYMPWITQQISCEYRSCRLSPI